MPDANVRINGSQPACADGRIDTRGLLHRGCSFARAAQTPLRAWHDCTGSALDLSRRGIRVPDRLHGVWDHRGRRQGSCAHRQPLEPPCTFPGLKSTGSRTGALYTPGFAPRETSHLCPDAVRAAPSHLLFLPSSLPSRACLDHSRLGVVPCSWFPTNTNWSKGKHEEKSVLDPVSADPERSDI